MGPNPAKNISVFDNVVLLLQENNITICRYLLARWPERWQRNIWEIYASLGATSRLFVNGRVVVMPLRLIPCKQSKKRWGGPSRRRVSQLPCSCGWLLLSTTLSHRSDYLYINWTNKQRLPHTNTSSDFKISRPLIKTDDWEQNIDSALFTIKSSAKILLPPAMLPLPIALSQSSDHLIS